MAEASATKHAAAAYSHFTVDPLRFVEEITSDTYSSSMPDKSRIPGFHSLLFIYKPLLYQVLFQGTLGFEQDVADFTFRQ